MTKAAKGATTVASKKKAAPKKKQIASTKKAPKKKNTNKKVTPKKKGLQLVVSTSKKKAKPKPKATLPTATKATKVAKIKKSIPVTPKEAKKPVVEESAVIENEDAPLKKKRVKKYLNNADIMIAVRDSKANGRMSHRLAHMLQTLCGRYARKGCYSGYSYNDDMQGYAMLMLVHTWDNFDPERSSNPFAFYTQCIKNSFSQFLNREKKHRLVRDELLVNSGMNPSYGYTLDFEEKNHHGHGNEDNEGQQVVTETEGHDTTSQDMLEF